jgi:predicted phage terminase large subunit-like protein
VLIIDDPVKGPKEADSLTFRDAAWDWWEWVGSTRLAPGAFVVVVMTRWHEDDLAGRLLREEPDTWRLLNIPALADHRPELGESDPLGREPGEYMISARRRTVAQWQRIQTQRGSRVWSALYQGRPSPGEGLVFRREWWKRYETPQWIEDDGVCRALSFDEVAQSWDMAFKDTDGADFVVGQVWGRRGDDAYLLDQVRGRMSFVDTCMAVRQLSARWPQATAKFVEDKANGTAVINQLRAKVPGLIPIEPDGSKVARASAVSPFVEAGNVWLPVPEIAAWVGGFIEECANFPLSTHDDQVDAASQALNRLLLNAVRPRVRWM